LIWIPFYSGILAFYPKSIIQDDMADNHALLLEIAPVGVFPHDQLPDQGVSSYLTISPLPVYALRAAPGRPTDKLLSGLPLEA